MLTDTSKDFNCKVPIFNLVELFFQQIFQDLLHLFIHSCLDTGF